MKNRGVSAVVVLVVLSAALVTVGCGGSATPDDLPSLTACTLTVTYKGAPLADATVALTPESGTWTGVGKSDASGVAVIRTSGKYDGLPAGNYKVSVRKVEVVQENAPATAEEDAAMAASGAKNEPKLLVPKKYTDPETSGLTVTVADSPVAETLELTD